MCIINVIHSNYPKSLPPHSPWKNCLLQNQSLVPKRLGTAALEDTQMSMKTAVRRIRLRSKGRPMGKLTPSEEQIWLSAYTHTHWVLPWFKWKSPWACSPWLRAPTMQCIPLSDTPPGAQVAWTLLFSFAFVPPDSTFPLPHQQSKDMEKEIRGMQSSLEYMVLKNKV